MTEPKLIHTAESKTTQSIANSESEVVIKDDAPVIVIDPGHGYKKGNTGASSRVYTYKVKSDDGKLTGKNASSNVEELPQYVIDDTSLIVSVKEDYNRPERALVYDIAVKLKELLEAKSYSVFLTREEKVIDGTDNSTTRKARIDLANDNKADYFISIHADGAEGYTSSGAHAIYPDVDDSEVVDSSKEFSEDILSCYDIVAVLDDSPKKDSRGLQVLRDTNKTKRKTLLELGFITSPKDAQAMFLNIDKIAEQLKDGLVKNIEKHFKES